ncbi:MAG TPA: hypothetical protein VG889_14090 [Rhizomicrobium sp.]|nr:hypothetical protein [Rhizomicrobium sp.]
MMDGADLFAFFNSNFFSAAFGAVAGALAATWLGRRKEKQRLLLHEIAACNVAIGQCAAIANVFVAIKRQRLVPMYKNYLAEHKRVLEAAIGPKHAQPVVLNVSLDLQALTPAWTPIDALNNILSTRVLSAYEPTSLAASVTQAIHNQRHAMDQRNSLIKEYPTFSDDERMARYFGLSLPSGHIDRSYPDLMQGLIVYTDDCIYFSTLLSDVLTTHGEHLATRLGDLAPPIKRMDFSDVRRDGLMPDIAQYAAFERQYRPKNADISVVM